MTVRHELSALPPKLKQEIIDYAVGTNLVAFIRMVFETVVQDKELLLNWHVTAIAYALLKVMRGETKRLIITMPPRSLKSICATVAFPVFLLGHDPTRRIISISYSHELAQRHAADRRVVLNSRWFRRAFPQMRLGLRKNTETEIVTRRGGGCYATSVGGTLTGRGGNLVILDDPIKAEDGYSETARNYALHWLETTLLSRLDSKLDDAIIVIMQRLHVDDLVGVLLEKGGWEHLSLPAIAQEKQKIQIGAREFHVRSVGDLLHPEREPLQVLEDLKRSMGTAVFSAQYLQSPIPAEGNLIKLEWLKFYDEPPPFEQGDRHIISWDTAMSSSELADYSVATVWHLKGGDCYLLDLMRDRFEYPDLKRAALALKERWPRADVLVEKAGSGTSLIQDLRDSHESVIGIKPEADKVTRLFVVQPTFEAGSVIFPSSAPWLEDLVSELLVFPNGRHDDQVDSISQALNWVARRRREFASEDIAGPILIHRTI